MLGYQLMSKVFGSSGRRSNPIGVLSILTGVGGAGISGVLWIYRVEPGSHLLGRYSADLAGGGQFADQLVALAAVLGLMAILSSVMSTTGGEGGSYFIGFILGLASLSYPAMIWLDSLKGSVQPHFLN
jgi:hypothetical protein